MGTLEQHFLQDTVDKIRASGEHGDMPGPGTPWYNPYGDSIHYLDVDESTVIDWVDNYVTLYRSLRDDRVIGFKLKDIRALMAEFGYDGLEFQIEVVRDDGEGIEIRKLAYSALHKKEEPKREKTAKTKEFPEFKDGIKSIKDRIEKQNLVELDRSTEMYQSKMEAYDHVIKKLIAERDGTDWKLRQSEPDIAPSTEQMNH